MSVETALPIETPAELLALVRRNAHTSADAYDELAGAFSVANNPATEGAFRVLAEGGRRHAATLPAPQQGGGRLSRWGERDPGISDPDSVHYLMGPWFAYELAVRHESQILDDLREVMDGAADPAVRRAAADLIPWQQTRIDDVLALREGTRKPEKGWWEDHDGPNWLTES